MSLFDGFENYPCLNAFVWLHGSYAIIPCLQMWFMHHHGIINHDKCYNCSTSKTIFHIQQDCELAWGILGISLFYFNLPHFFTMIDVCKIKWIIILVSFWLNKMLQLIVAIRIYGFFSINVDQSVSRKSPLSVTLVSRVKEILFMPN